MAGAAEQPRVFVADAQPLFREAVVRTIRQTSALRMIGEAGCVDEALRAILELEPDVAVVDLELPERGGVAVLHALARAGSSTRVLLMADDVAPEDAYGALVAGARGYVARWVGADELRSHIAAVAADGIALAPEAQSALAAEIVAREHRRRSALTARQLRVLALVADGRPTRVIADELRVSVSAVRSDLAGVFERLHVPDRAAAVAAALRLGLIR